MSEPEQCQALLERVRAGDEEAARQLYDANIDRLLPLVRRRLSQRLARRVDPEDIVQSVFRTFFHRVKEGQFRIADTDSLTRLLMRITVRKTLHQVAYHLAAKRDPRLEASSEAGTELDLAQLLTLPPTDEAALIFLDQFEHFLAALRPEDRRILELRLAGRTNEEVAQQLGTYDRRVRRVIEQVRALAEAEGLL